MCCTSRKRTPRSVYIIFNFNRTSIRSFPFRHKFEVIMNTLSSEQTLTVKLISKLKIFMGHKTPFWTQC